MSVSYDVDKDLATFKAFLEFVQNPKKYLEIIKDIEKGVEGHKSVIAKYEAIGSIDSLKEQASKLVEEATTLLDNSKKEAASVLLKVKKEEQESKEKAAYKLQELSVLEEQLKYKEMLLNDREAKVSLLEKEVSDKQVLAELANKEALDLKKEYESKKKALLGVLS